MLKENMYLCHRVARFLCQKAPDGLNNLIPRFPSSNLRYRKLRHILQYWWKPFLIKVFSCMEQLSCVQLGRGLYANAIGAVWPESFRKCDQIVQNRLKKTSSKILFWLMKISQKGVQILLICKCIRELGHIIVIYFAQFGHTGSMPPRANYFWTWNRVTRFCELLLQFFFEHFSFYLYPKNFATFHR
jgi:hypothetical protein